MNKFRLAGLQKPLTMLAWVILAVGAALRMVVYLQNRCLIIDEANVARNIYERGFEGLVQPLDYEQYAPPVFLWVLELSSLLFGFSEYALRLFPLACGIASLWLLYRVLKHYADHTSIWYVLLLMAGGTIYLRYATELKQYATDVVVALALILLALRLDIVKQPPGRFFLLWLLAGTVAIWSSMPSVFMLAAVGAYYLLMMHEQWQYGKLYLLAGLGVLWAGQFAFYYFTLLQPHISSEYLQSFHEVYFLTALPASAAEWVENWNLLSSVLGNAAGHWALSTVFHVLAMVVGAAYLLRKHRAKAVLLLLPLLLVIIAAAMHQFSLIPRVVLFAMPLMLVLIAKGLELMFRINFWPLRIVLLAVAAVCIVNFSRFDLFFNRMENEEITQSFHFLQEQNISGSELYLHEIANPAYIYYTQMHPRRQQWQSLTGASILTWQTDYHRLAQEMKGRKAFLYSYLDPGVLNPAQAIIREQHHADTAFHRANSHVFVYGEPLPAP